MSLYRLRYSHVFVLTHSRVKNDKFLDAAHQVGEKRSKHVRFSARDSMKNSLTLFGNFTNTWKTVPLSLMCAITPKQPLSHTKGNTSTRPRVSLEEDC
jgi:hypothetical protein